MKMVLKPFWRRTRPDNSQKQFRNPYTVAGYVVDQWRKAAYLGTVFGVSGIALAGAAWGYALYKERPPEPHYTIVDPESGHIRTYSGDLDPIAQDEIYGAVLRTMVRELREIPGSETDAKKRMERASLFFANRGGSKMRKRLDDTDWSKPIIRRGQTREVSRRIRADRVPETQNLYVLAWEERIIEPNGHRNPWVERSMQVSTAISKDIPVELKSINPWGLFVIDWTGDID